MASWRILILYNKVRKLLLLHDEAFDICVRFFTTWPHDRTMNPWPWPSALKQTRFKCQFQFYNTVTQDRLCLKSILGQWQTIPLQFHLSTWDVSCSVDTRNMSFNTMQAHCDAGRYNGSNFSNIKPRAR